MADHTFLEGDAVRIVDRKAVKKAAPNHEVSRASYMSHYDQERDGNKACYSTLPEFQQSSLHSAQRDGEPLTPIVQIGKSPELPLVEKTAIVSREQANNMVVSMAER